MSCIYIHTYLPCICILHTVVLYPYFVPLHFCNGYPNLLRVDVEHTFYPRDVQRFVLFFQVRGISTTSGLPLYVLYVPL